MAHAEPVVHYAHVAVFWPAFWGFLAALAVWTIVISPILQAVLRVTFMREMVLTAASKESIAVQVVDEIERRRMLG